ncbi:hypothetical protein CH063_13561 [Colletotrichum higginsianum]|uniref:Uncharacterized protein n=1 Tax=Colletotrichum higginsianum (strain IMI 349063) TaxID=759273 RepID=H1VUW3_COLHI|nr:hypothetical protein CH063_13561 [Colletotrichum higginsianum]
MKSATDCPPLTQEPPQGRPAVDGPPSPAASGPAVMSPSDSTDTAITVGSHNDNEHENDTESLTDSVREHMYENRLRYHAYRSGRYAFPNDATEQDRDEMKHIISVELCGRYFFSPVDDVLARGAEVLDLGEYSFSNETTTL